MSDITLTLTIIGIVIAAILLWGVVIYNNFIRLINLVKEGWSGIDVQLKRRYDLIPNLVETVKGYIQYEEKVFAEITALRAQAAQTTDIKQRAQLESALSTRIAGILVTAENYPALRASESFANLQKNLADVEEQIQLARRYYNGTSRNLNTLIESFPSLLIAKLFKFNTADYFEITDANERAVPQVKF